MQTKQPNTMNTKTKLKTTTKKIKKQEIKITPKHTETKEAQQ